MRMQTKMYKLKLGDWGLAINAAEEVPFSRSGTLVRLARYNKCNNLVPHKKHITAP